jgi:hypothetical protein
VAREYALPHSGRRHSDANMFRRLEQRLLETAQANAGLSRTIWAQPMKIIIISAVGLKQCSSRNKKGKVKLSLCLTN